MALTRKNVTDTSTSLFSNNQQPSTLNLFDDLSIDYFSSLTSIMNLSDTTTVKISNSNNNNNNNNLAEVDFASLFASSILSATPKNSIGNLNNTDNESSTIPIDDAFLNQVNDLTYCSSPILDQQQSIGPPPGFENFIFNTSSTSDLLVSKTMNNNPTISSLSNAAMETPVSSSDTINFSQLLKSTAVDKQQQQQSMVGNAGNIRSSSSSSHSPFTSDEQSLFFPISTQSYSSSSSSSSTMLHATSQIFSTNAPSLSTTTTSTTNSAAKPHIPNSLSLYNNNQLSSSSSSLITCNTIDSPLSSTTIEHDKKMTNDKRITPSHIFPSANSFFSNESTDYSLSKSKAPKHPASNHQSSINARTASSSTSSSTSSSIDEALIQLTQQQQQQHQTQNVNKLFNEEPLSLFNYTPLQSKVILEKQQEQAVHENINFLASMAAASTPMTSAPVWQQQIPATATSLDSAINLKSKMRTMMLQQQPTNLSQTLSGYNSINMHELIEHLNEICYKGFDELNALIQEQRWVQSYVNINSLSMPSPSSPSSSLNGTNCGLSRILIVPEYFIYKCKKLEITASHVFQILATGKPELRLRDLMFVFKSWKKAILNAELIQQDEENKLRLSTEHPQSYYMTDAVLQSVFDRVSYAIRELSSITQQARAAFQYATLNIYQASCRQQQVQPQISLPTQASSTSTTLAQLQSIRQQK